MRSRTKMAWIVALSAALMVVVFGSVMAVARPFTNLSANWTGNPFASGGGWNGRVYATQDLQAAYPMRSGQSFSLSIPLGEITIVPGTGNRIVVHAVARIWGATGAVGRSNVRRLRLDLAENAIGDQVNLSGGGAGLHFKAASVTVSAPPGSRLSIHNSLGAIKVLGGTYTDLTLHTDMGQIVAQSTVTRMLNLSNNMGTVDFSGQLAPSSSITDNMGSVSVFLPRRQSLQFFLSTDMGSATASLPGARVSQTGHSANGALTGPGTPATLTCRDNMGSITLAGEWT